jgi:hypothetical protein
VEVYDPALCCSSGVCGPDPDDALIRFAADLDWVRAAGIPARRLNLGQEASAFAANTTVRAALAAGGLGCLPLVLVDGEIFTEGRYPTRSELAVRLMLAAPDAE